MLAKGIVILIGQFSNPFNFVQFHGFVSVFESKHSDWKQNVDFDGKICPFFVGFSKFCAYLLLAPKSVLYKGFRICHLGHAIFATLISNKIGRYIFWHQKDP